MSGFLAVFLWKFAPETKGKSFAEINAEFAKMNGVEVQETEMLKSDEKWNFCENDKILDK